MKLRALLVLCLMASLLTGCMDHWYPNDLSGNINNNIYSNHPRVGRLPSFDTYSVMVPQRYNEYDLPMLYAKEKLATDYTIVAFGPSVTDQTVYSVMIINKKNNSMSYIKEKYFPAFVRYVDNGADRQFKKIYQTDTHVNGKPALYEVFQESNPSIYSYVSQRDPGNVTVTHAVYFADYGKYAVIFWMRYHSDSNINQVNAFNYRQVIRERYQPQTMFLRSFRIHLRRPGCCDDVV